MTSGFLRLLVDKGRIVNLPGICSEFRRLSEEHRGFLRAQVEIAAPMLDEQERKLMDELARISGKKILLEKRVNPAILGGAIVHLGGKIIDRSVRRGLRTLADSLLTAES
jgi:F-type H+-transporting ATPase subunit delta